MKANYVNPFYKATQEVFRTMMDITPEKSSMTVVDDMASSQEANVVLGVTGDLKGSILLGFPREMALEMIRIMSGMELETIDRFASSALGEIANIIGGNATTLLSQESLVCDIVPPQIFVGNYQSFSTAGDQALLVSLDTPIGQFDLNISLVEK